MKIDNEFTVSVPIDQAWAVLTDLEGIAPCMPGAQLTGVDGDVYSGKVKIKVGPVVSEYAGTARFVEKDDADHRAVIDAKGRDSRGAGNASAVITARLRADGTRTVVTVDTDLKISGKIAQFGNGMIKEISGKLLGQFVDCLEGKLSADVPGTPAATTGSPDGAPEALPATDGPPDGVPEIPAVATGSPAIARQPDGAGETPSHPAPAPRETGEAGAPPPGPAGAGTAPAGTDELLETNGTVVAPQETVVTSREKGEVHAPPPGAAEAGAPSRRVIVSEVDAEPLDVMSIAGGSIYKRALPVIVVLLLAVALVVYFVVS
ncbi:SRPBCC domain-containing protein [Streptosporangium sp. G11]|uniref:SRPBCC family protein n=1 Tax=Streptosporangium sp. G11 TaxID=3436926 RepID=UPI003EBA75CC